MKNNIQCYTAKGIRYFLLCCLLLQTTAEAQSQYQPEFTSFESISTTDMVNLNTGDFTYSIPLVNVPGPEGGFSMPLSYHAGIKLNQEASWVGLGWNINPGVITRNVSQYPDDYNGGQVISVTHDNGGESHQVFIPLELIGLPSLSLSWDSERGYGGSVGYRSVSVGFGTQAGFSAMGISANSNGVSFNPLGVATKGLSMAGAQDLANGLSAISLGQVIAGVGSEISNVNDWTIKSKNYIVYQSMKYYLHKAFNDSVLGSLYFQNYNRISNQVSDFHSYIDEKDKENHLTSISCDNYNVSSSGVSGLISPYRTDVGTFGKPFVSFGDKDRSVKTNFRFSDELANYYDYHTRIHEDELFDLNHFHPSIDAGRIDVEFTRHNRDDTRNLQEFNFSKNHLASGKHIRWYTNDEILSGKAQDEGFIDFLSTSDRKAFRKDLPKDGVGGFSVTNIDGVTHHFALPVHESDYKTYFSTDIDKKFVTKFFNEFYATSWLLTAITGPDYVSRGEKGTLGEKDWGHWVKLAYGKFSSENRWRYPYAGLAYGTKSNYKGQYSSGVTEKYYLNTIQTRTHTALFLKALREDNRAAYVVDGFLKGGKFSSTHHGIYKYDGNLKYASENTKPSSSLALREIVLLKNEDYQAIQFLKSRAPSNADVIDTDSFASVWDVGDLDTSTRSKIRSKQLKRIEFKTDYSLCRGAQSSFSSAKKPPAPGEGNGGKLTLNEVVTYERGDVQLIPSYQFDYGEAQNNPNYHKDKWDGWGMYKSNGEGNRFGHQATKGGSQWSLKKITTPVGGQIEIDYERDVYTSVSGMDNFIEVPVKSVIDQSTIELYSSYSDISELLSPGDLVELNLHYGCREDKSRDYDSKFTIKSIAPTRIEFEDQLSNQLIADIRNNKFCKSGRGGINSYPLIFKSGKISKYVGDKYGGDIRVSKIDMEDESSNKYATKYIYTKDGTEQGRSSGVVSVEPSFINQKERDFEKYYDYPVTPVMYGKVTVLNGMDEAGDYTKKEVYNFTTPHSNMMRCEKTLGKYHGLSVPIWRRVTKIDNSQSPPRRVSVLEKSSSDIGNFLHTLDVSTSKLGQLNSRKIYSKTGFLQSSKDFIYTDEKHYDNLGLFTEGSMYYSSVEATRADLSQTLKKYHPSILKSVRINEGGIVKEIENTKYDLVTGNVLETRYRNSLGKKFRSQAIPAYHKYPEMGSKAINPNNKNMMSQQTADYLYSEDAQGNEQLVSASVQTWSKDWKYRDFKSDAAGFEDKSYSGQNIWRKHQSYAWKSLLNDDGTYKTFTDFDWNKNTQHTNWQKAGENRLFDHYSKPLETKDIKGRHAMTKMGYDQSYSTLSASNSRYTESYYSGAEDPLEGSRVYFEGEVKGAYKQYLSEKYAHTGRASVAAALGQEAFVVEGEIGPQKDFSVQDYKASVWVHMSNVSQARLKYEVLNTRHSKEVTYRDPATVRAGFWYLLQIDIPAEKLTVGAKLRVSTFSNNLNLDSHRVLDIKKCYFDDFRMQPLKASVNSYVYDDRGNLTAVLDANNFATRYTYDQAGRLLTVSREVADQPYRKGGFKTLQEHQYNYGREIE